MKKEYFKCNICEITCKNYKTKNCLKNIERRKEFENVDVLFCAQYQPNFEIEKDSKGEK